MQKVWQRVLLSLCLGSVAYGNDDWSLNNRFTIYGEYVYMKRNVLGQNHVIIQEFECPRCPVTCVCPPCDTPDPPPPTRTVLTTRKLMRRTHFESGYRVGIFVSPTECSSIDASYMNIGEWHAEATRCEKCCLRFPFCPLTCVCNFVNAGAASACFNSKFSTLEANYWEHVTARRCNYFSYSWLGGLRFFKLNEGLRIGFTRGGMTSHYRISTENELYGAQFGINLQVNPYRLISWDFTVKGGILANLGSQRTFLGDFGDTVVLRDYTESKTVASYMGSGNVTFTAQIACHVNFHVGYEGIYIANLVTPNGQIDSRFNDGVCCRSEEIINTRGRVYIQGVFAGIGIGF